MVGVAAAAAVATAAASAASAATAGGGAKGGGGAPEMAGMSQWERLFNRGTADMVDEERRTMEDALAQANFMQPEMYKLLGYEPIYDDRGATPENLAALGKAVDTLNLRQQEGKVAIANMKPEIAAKRKELNALKGKGNREERRQLREDIRELRQAAKQAKHLDGPLQKEAYQAQKALSDAQTMPRRVIGMKKLDHPADPTQSGGDLYRVAFDLQNESLVRALKGEQPVDATLNNEWNRKEQDLRERLRRQMGPDFETSTGGSQAIAAFDTERNAAFTRFNRQLVGELSQETESRANSLSNLTSARMQQLQYPANTQAARALQLGQVAGDRMPIANLFQHERKAQYEAKAAANSSDNANAAARGQAISALLGNAGQAVGAAGPTLGNYLGSGGTATPATVTVPSY